MPDDLWPFVPSPRLIDVVRGEGRTLHLKNGETLLDASGGAIIANIGLGRREVAEASGAALERQSYAIPPFSTPERVSLSSVCVLLATAHLTVYGCQRRSEGWMRCKIGSTFHARRTHG